MAKKIKATDGNLFSNYGLDERQREMSDKIGFSCFRFLYNLIWLLSSIWCAAVGVSEIQISILYVAFSYIAAGCVSLCIYAIKTSKHGVMNHSAAVSFSSSGITTAIISAIAAVALAFIPLGEISAKLGAIIPLSLAVFSVENIILYLCGKRNFKVLDEQMKEDEEDE
ncbi:MAG: hypothetical protein IJ035_05625 [Oscillospiraceae bacterium]|nr:hypothetical protein [Oscillospiraceae bacterium]